MSTTYFNIEKWPIVYFTANGDNQMKDEYFEDFKGLFLFKIKSVEFIFSSISFFIGTFSI